MPRARYIMVGGFLGAGKTTAILRAAERLQAAGLRVGLITNDQSSGLVDTTLLGAHGFRTEEIGGGCFCCRFQSLVEACRRVTDDARPDVLFAEPVGSCTDLVATVAIPLQQMYGDAYTIAPLSVLLDPRRAQRILGLQGGKSFSPKVLYVYEKQLEEANVIVVNKCDLLTDDERTVLQQTLQERYPRAQVMAMSARQGTGLKEWLDVLQHSTTMPFHGIDVDYDTYAEGEALLGWVNLTVAVSGPEFDGNRWLVNLLTSIQQQLVSMRPEGVRIAHLKATLTPDAGTDLAVANLVREEDPIEASQHLAEELACGELLINLRAEADPVELVRAVHQALSTHCDSAGIAPTIVHQDAFRPGRPTPTHRIVL